MSQCPMENTPTDNGDIIKSIRDLIRDLRGTMSLLKINEIETSVDVDDFKDSNINEVFQVARFYLKETTLQLITLQREKKILASAAQSVEKREDYLKRHDVHKAIMGNFTEYELKDDIKKMDSLNEFYLLMAEKTALSMEIDNLTAERELLLEAQLGFKRELKDLLSALNEKTCEFLELKSEFDKLSEEKRKIVEEYEARTEALEKNNLQVETNLIAKFSVDLQLEKEVAAAKDAEVKSLETKLQESTATINQMIASSEKVVKRLIEDRKELEKKCESNHQRLHSLTDEVKKLEAEKETLENKLASLNGDRRETNDYTTRLENLVQCSEQKVKMIKKKLSETSRQSSTVKKQQELTLKKQESKIKYLLHEVADYRERRKVWEGVKRSMSGKLSQLTQLLEAEKEKNRKLVAALSNYGTVVKENEKLKEEYTVWWQVKEEIAKEKKTLSNELDAARKDLDRLTHKYRKAKSECNERTTIIKKLERLFNESDVEYHTRIKNFDQHVTGILKEMTLLGEKVKEKDLGMKSSVTNLQMLLEKQDQEKKAMEDDVANCHLLIKRLEKDVAEKDMAIKHINQEFLVLHQEKNNECPSEPLKPMIIDRTVAPLGNGMEKEKQAKTSRDQVMEYRRLVSNMEANFEAEKSKLEGTIKSLQTQLDKYQIRVDVMMRNLVACGKNLSQMEHGKKNVEDTIKRNRELEVEISELKRKMEQKERTIAEFAEKYQKRDLEIASKDKELKELQEKVFNLLRESRITKDQVHTKNREVETAMETLKENSVSINKLKEEIKRLRAVVFQLKEQKMLYQEQKSLLEGNNNSCTKSLSASEGSAESLKARLSQVLQELKETRETNLQFRKAEGELKAQIVKLEDEIRIARLAYMEIQGYLKTEKRIRKSCSSMMLDTKRKKLKEGQTNHVAVVKVSKLLNTTENSGKSRHWRISHSPGTESASSQ